MSGIPEENTASVFGVRTRWMENINFRNLF